MFGLPEALMSFIRRQVGLRTDTPAAVGSLHAKTNHLVERAMSRPVSVSGVLQYSADTEMLVIGNTYVKKKEIQLYVKGRVRVTYDSKRGSLNAYTKLYVNGVAGTEVNNSSTTYVTYTHDIDVEGGETLALYAQSGSTSNGCYIRNFRVYYTLPTIDGEVTLD